MTTVKKKEVNPLSFIRNNDLTQRNYKWDGKSVEFVVQLGRKVIVRDLVDFAGCKHCSLCKGTGELTTEGKRRVCDAGLARFRSKWGWACIDTAQGPHWKAGREPELTLADKIKMGYMPKAQA